MHQLNSGVARPGHHAAPGLQASVEGAHALYETPRSCSTPLPMTACCTAAAAQASRGGLSIMNLRKNVIRSVYVVPGHCSLPAESWYCRSRRVLLATLTAGARAPKGNSAAAWFQHRRCPGPAGNPLAAATSVRRSTCNGGALRPGQRLGLPRPGRLARGGGRMTALVPTTFCAPHAHHPVARRDGCGAPACSTTGRPETIATALGDSAGGGLTQRAGERTHQASAAPP